MAMIESLMDIPENQSCYEFLVELVSHPSYDTPKSHIICHIVGSDSPLFKKVIAYLKENTLPPDLSSNQKRTFIRQASRYAIIVNTLY